VTKQRLKIFACRCGGGEVYTGGSGLPDEEFVGVDEVPEFHRVWRADQTPSLANFVSIPGAAMFFPPVGGVRVIVTTFAVEAGAPSSDLDINAAAAEAERRKAPGLLAHMECEKVRHAHNQFRRCGHRPFW
jgi:hypothetical protein